MDRPQDVQRKGGEYKKERKVSILSNDSIGNIDQEFNQYEYLKDKYEYIIEEESLLRPLSPASLNSIGTNRYNMFRRRSNPLYIKPCQDTPIKNNPLNKHLLFCGITIITVLFILSTFSLVTILRAIQRMQRIEEAIISSRNTSEPIVVFEENHLYRDQLRDHSQQIDNNRRNHKSLLRELESLELKTMKMMNETRFMNDNIVRLNNQRALTFHRCYYKTKESGNAAIQRSTQTEAVPEKGKDVTVTGVHCTVEGGTSAILKFSGSQYFCICSGQSQGIDSRFCKIHYWYCTHSE